MAMQCRAIPLGQGTLRVATRPHHDMELEADPVASKWILDDLGSSHSAFALSFTPSAICKVPVAFVLSNCLFLEAKE